LRKTKFLDWILDYFSFSFLLSFPFCFN
jgi:hypothetical protein